VSPTVLPTSTRESFLNAVFEEELSAIRDFTEVQSNELVEFYIDTKRQALAIDARKHKDKFAAAETVYDGKDGTFAVVVTALTETDGESTYKLFVNGNEIGSAQNPVSARDYDPVRHLWDSVVLKKGDTIQVWFNSVSNGKIPEGNSFAYSRGRWTALTIIG
jgi:isoleucyl-tRNA synthetase